MLRAEVVTRALIILAALTLLVMLARHIAADDSPFWHLDAERHR
jgi:sensor domain CHASE-containing protein